MAKVVILWFIAMTIAIAIGAYGIHHRYVWVMYGACFMWLHLAFVGLMIYEAKGYTPVGGNNHRD